MGSGTNAQHIQKPSLLAAYVVRAVPAGAGQAFHTSP